MAQHGVLRPVRGVRRDRVAAAAGLPGHRRSVRDRDRFRREEVALRRDQRRGRGRRHLRRHGRRHQRTHDQSPHHRSTPPPPHELGFRSTVEDARWTAKNGSSEGKRGSKTALTSGYPTNVLPRKRAWVLATGTNRGTIVPTEAARAASKNVRPLGKEARWRRTRRTA